MRRFLLLPVFLALALAAFAPTPTRSDESFAGVADEVNKKVVKVFGAGGIKGLASYGTGVLVSADGYLFTINSHILDTRDLRVHLYDGTRYHAKVVAREPELDVALVKIDKKITLDHFFDVKQAAALKQLEPGTGILGFSNQFQIATRDEPVSIQRGVIAAYAKMAGRVGVFEQSYHGNVYFVDAITNNPGAGGGVITTRKGELVGLIGRELRNELTNTWMNYCVPFNATAETPGKDGKKEKTSVLRVWELKEKYNPINPKIKGQKPRAAHGMVFVPNVVERTPPYVEEVEPGSPAEKVELKPDDLIVYFDGLPTPDINTFNAILAKYAPNSEIKLEVQRGDKLVSVTMTLVKLPEKKKE